jgi:hypothetical protein
MSDMETAARIAEALWRASGKRTVDWLEAPRREQREFSRLAMVALEAARVVDRSAELAQLRETVAQLSALNVAQAAALINAQRDVQASIEREISARIAGLHARASAEAISERSKKGLHQRAEELGSLLGELRASRKEPQT